VAWWARASSIKLDALYRLYQVMAILTSMAGMGASDHIIWDWP
jgi:hypothetical protein